MITLSFDGVGLEYGTDVILKNISFSVNEGERLGIVGVNGAGKSTLLKITTGEITPSYGAVYISKGKSIGILEQNAMLDSSLTVIDEMYGARPDIVSDEKRIDELTVLMQTQTATDKAEAYIAEYSSLCEKFRSEGGYEYRSRIKSTLTKFGFSSDDWDKKIDTLSGGQRTRLALVRLLLPEPDLLLLDEPTNHLDSDTLFWLEEHLISYPKTVVAVSHDRYFLDRVCTSILDIENREAKLYTGNYTAFSEKKQAARLADEKHYQLQQKEIARLEAYIEQQRRWNRERNIIAAESREKAIARMDKVDAPKAAPKSIGFTFTYAGETGNDVLTVSGLKKSYGDKRIFSDVGFLVKKNDRVLIIGPNGCGKSTLLKILGRTLSQDDGEVHFGNNVMIGYYDQEQKTLDENSTVFGEICRCHDTLTFYQIRSALAAFLFYPEDLEKPVSVLSGGEKARLMLCKMILSKTNVLILDEPTNHLDISSREALEKALLEFDGTIIAVSHDRYFINKLATRIFDMTDGFSVNNEGYSEYTERRNREKERKGEEKRSEKQTTESKQKFEENKKLLADIRKNENNRERAEARITELENEAKALTEEEAGEARSDYKRLNEISERLTEISEECDALYAEMDEAEKFMASVTKGIQ